MTLSGVSNTEKVGSALALSANGSLIAIGAPEATANGKAKQGYASALFNPTTTGREMFSRWYLAGQRIILHQTSYILMDQ